MAAQDPVTQESLRPVWFGSDSPKLWKCGSGTLVEVIFSVEVVSFMCLVAKGSVTIVFTFMCLVWGSEDPLNLTLTLPNVLLKRK